MTAVNSQIALTFHLQGYLVYPNLKYMVHKQKSSGESDIDLAVYNTKTGDRAIVEVKGWHSEYFTKSYFEEDDPDKSTGRIFHFIRKKVLEKAKEISQKSSKKSSV